MEMSEGGEMTKVWALEGDRKSEIDVLSFTANVPKTPFAMSVELFLSVSAILPKPRLLQYLINSFFPNLPYFQNPFSCNVLSNLTFHICHKAKSRVLQYLFNYLFLHPICSYDRHSLSISSIPPDTFLHSVCVCTHLCSIRALFHHFPKLSRPVSTSPSRL